MTRVNEGTKQNLFCRPTWLDAKNAVYCLIAIILILVQIYLTRNSFVNYGGLDIFRQCLILRLDVTAVTPVVISTIFFFVFLSPEMSVQPSAFSYFCNPPPSVPGGLSQLSKEQEPASQKKNFEIFFFSKCRLSITSNKRACSSPKRHSGTCHGLI